MSKLSDTTDRKFEKSISISDWEIDTDTGWAPISIIHKTILYQEYIIRTESGKELICADDHIIFDDNMNEIFVKNCIPGETKIVTRDGNELVTGVVVTDTFSNMYDVSVDDCNNRFWSGDILSHNTTVLDALTFCLYGKPFRKINKPQLINSTNNADLLIEIKFKTNNDEYLVRRGIKPTIFEIIENGKVLNQDAANRDYQEYLESNILKMNYKTFTQIVVIGNATYMPFMKLTPYDRRNIVESLLDIDIFSKMNTILKGDISETKEDIGSISYKCDLTKEKMKIHSNLISDSTNNLDSQIELNTQEIERNKLQLTHKKTQIDSITEEIRGIEINDDKLNSIRKKIDSISEYNYIFKNKIKNIQKEIEFFKNNDSCPTCTQNIDTNFRENVAKEKTLLMNKFVGGEAASTNELSNLTDNLNNILSNLEAITSNNHKINLINADLDSINKYIEKIERQTQSLLKQKLNDVKKIQSDYSLLEEDYNETIVERDVLLNKQHLQSIASILLKDDGIKTKIIRHYLPLMNKIINKYLQAMDFYVNFSLDENFDEVIKSKSKENFTYHSFSEGEKLRIDLSILFTWREIAKMKNAANCNLLVLDEIFDSSIDASGIDEFIKILSQNKETTNSFVISHRGEQLFDKFDRILKFTKINGFSKISTEV